MRPFPSFHVWKAVALGILVWLVPFLVSLVFYTPGGELSIDLITFKTIMLLVSQLTGAVVIWFFYRSVQNEYLRTGLALASVWILINWALDFLTLILMFRQPLGEYFLHTGFRYLGILITGALLGVILEEKTSFARKELEPSPER